MADLARALQTPVPATQPAPQTPASRTPAGPEPRASEYPVQDIDAKRDAKNKRDQERRKAQRAAHAKAVEAALAKKKKRKAKKKVAAAPAPARKKARGRGRPPGSKNKPKPPLMDTVFPPKAVGGPLQAAVVPRSTDPFSVFLTVRDMMRALLPAQRVQVLAALVNDNK